MSSFGAEETGGKKETKDTMKGTTDGLQLTVVWFMIFQLYDDIKATCIK